MLASRLSQGSKVIGSTPCPVKTSFVFSVEFMSDRQLSDSIIKYSIACSLYEAFYGVTYHKEWFVLLVKAVFQSVITSKYFRYSPLDQFTKVEINIKTYILYPSFCFPNSTTSLPPYSFVFDVNREAPSLSLGTYGGYASYSLKGEVSSFKPKETLSLKTSSYLNLASYFAQKNSGEKKARKVLDIELKNPFFNWSNFSRDLNMKMTLKIPSHLIPLKEETFLTEKQESWFKGNMIPSGSDEVEALTINREIPIYNRGVQVNKSEPLHEHSGTLKRFFSRGGSSKTLAKQ
nr:MAG: matrix protein [Rovyktys virus]